MFDYAYDVAGRLVGVKQNGTIQSSYGCDEGNRIDLNGTPIAYYDAQDRRDYHKRKLNWQWRVQNQINLAAITNNSSEK
jgi:hypothetical protein